MPEVVDQFVEKLADMNVENYLKGLIDGLKCPLSGIAYTKKVACKAIHEARGEHTCDEYCPPPF
jgi:hypothetical protein